jgi:predicted ATPase
MITSQFISRITLRRDKVDAFDRYPFCLPAIRSLDHLDLHPKATFLVGENGSGKSTLLEAIAVSLGFNAEGGTRNFRFGTRRSHSDLHQFLRVARGARQPRDGFFLRAESFFNVATEIEELDKGPGGPPIINSYGGRSLHEQPILKAYPEATIFQCSSEGIAPIAYEDTEHFKVTRDFLANPERMLKVLMERANAVSEQSRPLTGGRTRSGPCLTARQTRMDGCRVAR